MPHPIKPETAPERGKWADREEQGDVPLDEHDYKKKVRNQDGLESSVQQDDASEILSGIGLAFDAQALGSYAGMVYGRIDIEDDAVRRTPPECYELPFTFMHEESEDAEVKIVKEMIRRAEITGETGADGFGKGDGEMVDVGDVSILDCSEEVWDGIVAGSSPFVFDEGAAEGTGNPGLAGDDARKGK